jgi:NodT family efflux transporter outer membrane factor (OMF) lipoprotein
MAITRTARPGRASLLACMLMTSACASVPFLGPKPMPRAETDFAAQKALAGPATSWPAHGWWRAYGDPQLNELMEEAGSASPNLEAAAARLRSAEGYAQKASAALKPTIDGFAAASVDKYGQNNIIGPQATPNGLQTSGEVGLSFSLDLDLWGKNRAALRAARSDADAARFELEEAELTLTTNIAAEYADLAALYAQLDSDEDALDIRMQSAKLVKQRFDIGLDNQFSLDQANAKVSQAKADIEETTEGIKLSKNAIAALLGAGPDRALTILRPNIAGLHPQGVPADASTNLIGRRPDIAAYRARVEAAAERIKEARADFYPNVNLGGLMGFSSFGIGNLFSSGSFGASAGPAISLPLFHGGALQGQYRGRRGEYDEVVALYNGQVIGALKETADALTSQKMLEGRLANSRAALASYQSAYKVATMRYAHGLSTYLDVLSAQEGVVNAQLKVAKLQTRAFNLDVQLIRALGGGFNAA